MKLIYDLVEKPEAILFDMDGTIIDSMGMWHQIDIDYLARFNITRPHDLEYSIGGLSFHETAVYFKNHFEIPDNVEKIEEDWHEMAHDKYVHELPLKEGLVEFLKVLKANGIKAAIGTSNSRELVEDILNERGLINYFDAIVTAADVENSKPAPDVYLKAAEDLKVNPKKCIVIEDIYHGIMAGKAAGCKVITIWDSNSCEDDERKQKTADAFINDFTELL